MASDLDRLERELSDLDDGDQDGGRKIGAAPLAVAGLAVLALGGLVFYAYNEGIREGTEVAAPIITPEGPAKVKPEDPGGLAVPHQDKSVYNVVKGTGDTASDKVETLLPPPEEPVAMPKAEPAVDRAPTDGTPETILAAKPKVPTIQPPPLPDSGLSVPEGPVVLSGDVEQKVAAAKAESGEAEGSAIVEPASGPEPAAEKTAEAAKSDTASAAVKDAEKAAAATVAAETPAAAIKADTKAETKPSEEAKKPVQLAAAAPAISSAAAKVAGGWRVQVGAVRSEDAARKEWARLQKRNKDLLGDLSVQVQSVDVKDKGTFYRIRGGPLASKADAEALCGKLKAKKVACLTIRPDA